MLFRDWGEHDPSPQPHFNIDGNHIQGNSLF